MAGATATTSTGLKKYVKSIAIGACALFTMIAVASWLSLAPVSDEVSNSAFRSDIQKERQQASDEVEMLCPGIPNPVPEWTDYVAPANTGSPSDWEAAEVIPIPACSNADLRSSDDPSERQTQCMRHGKWPPNGSPSARSECDGVTAIRYLSTSSDSVTFQYKFVRLNSP